MTQTLPERLVLARQQKMTHAAFLQLVLADEITRRDSRSATLRARAAGLDPSMRLDTWDELDDLTYDRELLADLATLRFTEAGHGALVLGPVGVGKTHLASALGHIAIRRRMTVHAARADKLFTRLRACTAGQHPRGRAPQARPRRRADPRRLRAQAARRDRDQRLLRARRRAAPHEPCTVVTSNREPAEWLTLMSDALLAQSAVDRLTSGAHTLVIEGPSYRQRHPHRRAGIDPEGGQQ